MYIFILHFYNKNQRDALFLKFILINNSTCFGQIYCPSSGVSQHCIHSSRYLSYRLCWLSVSEVRMELTLRLRNWHR